MKTWTWEGSSYNEFFALYVHDNRSFYVYNSFRPAIDTWLVKSSRKLLSPVMIENIYFCYLIVCENNTKFKHEVHGGIEQIVVDVANKSECFLKPSLQPHGDDGEPLDKILHDWAFNLTSNQKDNMYHWWADHNYIQQSQNLRGGLE